jgi:hypothetical protein
MSAWRVFPTIAVRVLRLLRNVRGSLFVSSLVSCDWVFVGTVTCVTNRRRRVAVNRSYHEHTRPHETPQPQHERSTNHDHRTKLSRQIFGVSRVNFRKREVK